MGLDNPIHIAFIVVILLLVFGARRLPEIGRSLGTGLREFKQSITGESHQAQEPQQPTLPPAASQATAAPPQAPAATTQAPAAPQTPAPPADQAAAASQAQDAFAQREPAASDRR
ncbi:MAG TPA: twin-arginine translocase TatA/TatE family subunit [Solirubrobacteraceae bacterium]|jgi:sec-independent protein translocase protein TatA|nr:twin-arginine translocase TatA/TatE family subunit [Solirubrobacteraceae bacterium]